MYSKRKSQNRDISTTFPMRFGVPELEGRPLSALLFVFLGAMWAVCAACITNHAPGQPCLWQVEDHWGPTGAVVVRYPMSHERCHNSGNTWHQMANGFVTFMSVICGRKRVSRNTYVTAVQAGGGASHIAMVPSMTASKVCQCQEDKCPWAWQLLTHLRGSLVEHVTCCLRVDNLPKPAVSGWRWSLETQMYHDDPWILGHRWDSWWLATMVVTPLEQRHRCSTVWKHFMVPSMWNRPKIQTHVSSNEKDIEPLV